MARRNSPGRADRSVDIPRPRRFVRPLSRHDLALVAIPLAFLLGTIAHVLTAIPLRLALALAAAVGVVILADALYLNPPGTAPPS